MVDPVVSSKYGKRPILEMPALHVDSDSRVEISSLQARPNKHDTGLPSMIYRSDGINTVPTAGQQIPSAMSGIALPASAQAGLPPIPGAGGPGSIYSPQPGGAPMYQQPPYPMQPQNMYPAFQPPYAGTGGFMPPYAQGVLPRTPVPANFHVEGVLQYGQLTTIHFRDKTSNFQGIPDYLRHELMKTYGQYPVTDIRIMAINGQFHIYASPRDADEFDEFGAYGPVGVPGLPMTPSARMVGFNEVRGHPRSMHHGDTL